MKTIKELVKEVNSIIPAFKGIIDGEGRLIAGSLCKDKPPENNELYPICINDNLIYYLYCRGAIAEDTIELLKLAINSSLLNTSNKKSKVQIIKSLMDNEIDLISLEAAEELLLSKNSFTLMWIQINEDEELLNLHHVIKESFKGDGYSTVVATLQGILIFIEGHKSKEKLLSKGKSIRDTVNSELYIDLRIGISNKYSRLKDFKKYFLETKEIVELGGVFYPEEHIYFAEDLKVEKLLYAIPKELKEKIFIELFYKEIYYNIEEEMLKTISVFIDNNLSMRDTAKALFIHRNTLAYRLDKINKELGLDLRSFKDALIFKISWLLKKSVQ
ncbi:hypothetical protein F8154_09690 [Alkaliphilus pronyensis]|uniref:PucR C-terminal helix-turn-helix domain-containing protein n=1 Tax=Alkaliphilus pronyensis TaxID=1482732 RepID=A0A6I0F7E3_9FIRM|nr:helix-turn-helix domain-containing protein [Alkaliphilus pronyensis]KAB3534097.1 hypothetical protein F8154_09690 [Alkaliphilus pronyensis]